MDSGSASIEAWSDSPAVAMLTKPPKSAYRLLMEIRWLHRLTLETLRQRTSHRAYQHPAGKSRRIFHGEHSGDAFSGDEIQSLRRLSLDGSPERLMP